MKSVLSIIAADIRNGDRCSVQVSGTDEKAAYTSIHNFIEVVLPTCDVPIAEAPPTNQEGMPRVLRSARAVCYSGLPASPGIARGAVLVINSLALPGGISEHSTNDPTEELARLHLALKAVRDRICTRMNQTDALESAILRADLAMADDVSLAERLAKQVSSGKSASYAVLESAQYFAELLRRSGSDYLRDRAADLQEMSFEILKELHGDIAKGFEVKGLDGPSIVIAETLGPQQLLAFERRWLKGIVIEHAGTTSHALILARSFGIPAVVGVKNACAVLSSAQEILAQPSTRFFGRTLREAQRQADVLIVLLLELHSSLRSECSYNGVCVELLWEKFRRMLGEFIHEGKLKAREWESWRERLVESLLRMRDLKQTIVAISARYYDCHPLLFTEDERKLNDVIAWLEKLSRIYNSFEDDIPTVQPLNLDGEFRSTPARVEARVAYYEVIANTKTWTDFGYPEAARELIDPYAMRVLRDMKQVGTAQSRIT